MSRSMEEFAKRWAEEEIQIRNEDVALELLRMDVMDYGNVAKVSKLSVEEVKKLAELQLV